MHCIFLIGSKQRFAARVFRAFCAEACIRQSADWRSLDCADWARRPSNPHRQFSEWIMGGGVVRFNMRATILIAFAAVLVFASPAYMRAPSRSTQEEQTENAKKKPPAEAPPRVIAMTAKDFAFDPAEIHLKVGEKVRLQVISSDRTHGIHVSAFPDGAKANTPPGLSFIFGEDCWKLRKGEAVPVDIEATEPGTYSFRCCKSCGTGQTQMTGRIYVEP
jgi:heme/copper-type cytochrome/quinol oxidase subunit 2